MPKREMQISDAERKRRSDNAKKLAAEGRIGPQFGKLGGRPRKQRATELAAEAARKDSEKLIQVLQDGIAEDQPMRMRLATAQTWFGLEQDEAKLQLQEEKHEIDVSNASRDELIEYLTNALSQGPIADQIGFIDGTAEPIDDAEIIGPEATSDNGSGG